MHNTPHLKKWGLRCLGWITVLYCMCGITFYAWELISTKGVWPGSPHLRDWLIFALLSAFTLGLTSYLGYLATRLARGDEAAIQPMRVLWWIEIAYFCANVAVFWQIIPSTNPGLTLGFFSFPEGPFDPQLVTGYPVIGLIAVFLLSRPRPDRGDTQALHVEQ